MEQYVLFLVWEGPGGNVNMKGLGTNGSLRYVLNLKPMPHASLKSKKYSLSPEQ